jgi:hypothetical protein
VRPSSYKTQQQIEEVVMGGAMGAISGIMQAVQPLMSMIPGLDKVMEGVQAATQAASKLQDAAKSATGADKMQIDAKLGTLKDTATAGLTQAQGLLQNAAASGVPQAAQVGAAVQNVLGALGAK